MVLTIVLNPCVDKTLWVDHLELDVIAHPDEMQLEAGGKGVNVSRVLSHLGEPNRCISLSGGLQGLWYEQLARAEGVDLVNIPIEGHTRCVTTIVERGTHRQVAFAEPGAPVTEKEWDRFFDAFDREVKSADFVMLQGSLPADEYAWVHGEIIRRARRSGCRVWLDSRDEGLRQGIAEHPDFIKPNDKELAQLTGKTGQEGIDAILEIVPNVIYTMGSEGAKWITKEETLAQGSYPIEYVNAVGSGDSFSAGFVYGLEHGWEKEETLRFASLLGALNAAQWHAAYFTKEEILQFMQDQGVRLPLIP